MRTRRAEVLRLYSLGIHQSEIARSVQLSRQRIHQIVGKYDSPPSQELVELVRRIHPRANREVS